MKIEEIAQQIYGERYVDPKEPQLATYIRDTMIREIVARTLELAAPRGPVMTPGLATAIADTIAQSAAAVLEMHGIRAELGDLAREIGNNAAATVVFVLHEASVVDAEGWVEPEAPNCRCEWNGVGPHMCHRCGMSPGSSRHIAEKACVVIPGKLPRLPTEGARETWSCDACWAPYAADGSFRGGR